MSTQIQPGDIVQKVGDTSQMIYEIIRTNGEWATIRPLWGSGEQPYRLKRLERMCDETANSVLLARMHEKTARLAMSYGAGAAGMTPNGPVTQTFAPGDEVRVLDKRGLSLADTTFLDSRPVHIVKEMNHGQVVLVGCAWQFRADRFELVRAGANHQAPITISVAGGGGGGGAVGRRAIARPVPVPDAKFTVGQVVEWDAPGTTEVVTALVQDAQWAGVAWLYGCEIIGGAKKGLVGRVLEHYLRESSGEVEHHKHHHHEKHKHVMGLDHDEIDPDAYREFMRSL